MLFKAPPSMHIQWDIRAIKGVHKWLNRIWTLCHDHISACQSSSAHECSDEDKKQLVSLQHSTIKQVTHLLESHTYNVAVAQLMIFCNQFKKLSESLEYHRSLEVLCTLLAPMAPHIASELWESLAGVSERSKPLEKWPSWTESLILQESTTVVLQVNGVRKGSFSVLSEMCDPVNRESLQSEAVKVALERNMLCNSDNYEFR